MQITWPETLLLVLLIPVLIGLYIWMLNKRKRYAIRYSNVALVREVMPHRSRLRRHIPFALFLLGLVSLIVAVGRPFAMVTLPADQSTIILAIDVSRSMLAEDVKPNRMEAAQKTVMSFIDSQKPSTQIGIVAFAGEAELVQAPTSDHKALNSAVRSLITARRTAIGSGILKSLETIAESGRSQMALATDTPGSATPQIPVTGDSQGYVPEIIVLLTDGMSNSGPLPLQTAQLAVQQGVRIYTIGYGTNDGYIPSSALQFGSNQPFSSNSQLGGFNGSFRTGIDEPTLKMIAKMTGGEYFAAASADELQHVFDRLSSHTITQTETMEISVFFTALGALVAAIAIGLSLLWHPWP